MSLVEIKKDDLAEARKDDEKPDMPEGDTADAKKPTDTVRDQEKPADAAKDAGKQVNAAKEQQDETLLDLAFAMDCTGSMGSYIEQARQNIRTIVEEIVRAEKSDVRLALVEYRDHPPQDSSFVTRVLDFTSSVGQMKTRLNECSASGGGDAPEAVADALNELLKLSWRPNATKICVFIADAPPHGLGCGGDGFPNGCPNNLDPMEITNRLAEEGVTLYLVGCEPSITPYKDFCMALTHMTGGQYVPLRAASVLSQVIIGGAREEISLQRLMDDVNAEVVQNYEERTARGEAVNMDEMVRNVQERLKVKGAKSNKLRYNNAGLSDASTEAQELSKCASMSTVRSKFKATPSSGASLYAGIPRSRAMAKAPPKAMKKKSGGGITGFVSSMLGWSSKEEAPDTNLEEEDLKEEGLTGSSYSVPAPGAPSDDRYDCVEQAVDEVQARRMVTKAMRKNKFS